MNSGLARNRSAANGAVEIVFADAAIVTLDPARPRARSLRVRGDTIVDVSSDPDPAHGGEALRIDCGGATLVPGFIDAHLHLLAWARSQAEARCGPPDVRTIADLQRTLRDALRRLPDGTWLVGRGYDDFTLGRHPNRDNLDAVAPRHPVCLAHRSGHAHALNSAALARLGIGNETGDPPGGLIDREPLSGRPSGVLFGMQREVARALPRLDDATVERQIASAGRALSGLGITSLHDVSERNGLDRLEQLRDWHRRGLLAARVDVALGWEAFESLDEAALGVLAAPHAGNGLVRVTGVKLSLHEVTGRLHPKPVELARRVALIHRRGWQVLIHAVEPAAIATACDSIERAQSLAPRADARHRIEHASLCTPALARRLATAGIVVVTQPGFVGAHGARYRATVPAAQQPLLYPLATLLGAGVRVAASSDAPVGPADPLCALRAAVDRRDADGEPVAAQQAIMPEEALRLATAGAAFALRDEHRRGSLRAGLVADLILLSDDPTRSDSEPRVLRTFVGGRASDYRNA